MKNQYTPAETISANLETRSGGGKRGDARRPLRAGGRGGKRPGQYAGFGIGIVLGVMAVLVIEHNFEVVIGWVVRRILIGWLRPFVFRQHRQVWLTVTVVNSLWVAVGATSAVPFVCPG